MKASDLLVAALENEGVEYIFGVPGEENLDVLDSLSRSSIEFILTRHEQGAGFMAATYGRLTGKAGVCLATLGPGATNLVTPAAYAQLGAMPTVVLTGQKPIKSSKQGRFQLIDVVNMMTPITKYTKQIVSAANIPSRVREAFRLAEEERPGACHLELPEDIAREETDERPLEASFARRPTTEIKAIRQALKLLRRAKRPLLTIGAGANRKLTAKMLRAFVDKQGIPFITTQMGKGVVNENHPLFLGNAALSDSDFPHRAVRCSDLILNVGHDAVEKPPFVMSTGERKIIHINFASAEVDPVYFPHIELIGDIANSIWQLNQGLEPQKCWNFKPFMRFRDAMQAHIDENRDSQRFPLSAQRVVREVRRAMPEDGIIALDNGVFKIWFARNYRAARPNTVLLDNALASMGAGVCSAIAAKLVRPESKVMAICGDGGFMMNSQEIETAVRLGTDLVVLILNDNAYGMVKGKQRHTGFKDYGLSFDNPDFVLYAKSYGATGHRVQETEALAELLTSCLNSKGVHIIEIPVDYSDDDRVLYEEIPTISRELDLS